MLNEDGLTMRPFVFINVAVTADGKMDTSERKGSAISSPEDNERVQQLRSESDAVMVGGHTLLDEDPKLTIKSNRLRLERKARGLPENPIKVGVVTKADLRLDGNFMMDGTARRVIFTTSKTSPEQIKALEALGAEVYISDSSRVDLVSAFETLSGMGVHRLMVEGGGTLNFELLRQGLVDELMIYLAAKIFGGQTAPTLAEGKGYFDFSALKLELLNVQKADDRGGVLLH